MKLYLTQYIQNTAAFICTQYNVINETLEILKSQMSLYLEHVMIQTSHILGLHVAGDYCMGQGSSREEQSNLCAEVLLYSKKKKKKIKVFTKFLIF